MQISLGEFMSNYKSFLNERDIKLQLTRTYFNVGED